MAETTEPQDCCVRDSLGQPATLVFKERCSFPLLCVPSSQSRGTGLSGVTPAWGPAQPSAGPDISWAGPQSLLQPEMLDCVSPTSAFMVLFYDTVYWFFLVMEGTHPHKFPIQSPNTKVSGDERQQENQGPLPLQTQVIPNFTGLCRARVNVTG